MQTDTQRRRQQNIPNPKLSEARTRNYFVPRRVSRWGWIVLLMGVLLVIISFTLFNFTIFAVGMLLGITSIVYIVLIFTANPSDRQYDQWVSSQARAMYAEGLEAFGLDRHALSAPAVRIHSIVLPGSIAAEVYPDDEVRMRIGNDGKWHYSIHVYTYFYPTSDYIAIFKGDINAWNHSEDDAMNATYMYHYHDIMNAGTNRFIDTVTFEGTPYPYRLDEFYLELSNGRLILSAALKARLLNRRQAAPTSLLPEMVSEQTLRRLRDLLLSR